MRLKTRNTNKSSGQAFLYSILDRKSEQNLTISSAYWISLLPSSMVYLRLGEPVGWAVGT